MRQVTCLSATFPAALGLGPMKPPGRDPKWPVLHVSWEPSPSSIRSASCRLTDFASSTRSSNWKSAWACGSSSPLARQWTMQKQKELWQK